MTTGRYSASSRAESPDFDALATQDTCIDRRASTPRTPALSPLFRKIGSRVVVFLLVSYALAIVDRINVGFAALTMNADLSFSPLVFGTAAGMFFLGYFAFEVPSVWHLRRIGARRWIARILVTWGLITIAIAYVRTAPQFYVLRFLLGAAEAGLYPGVIYFLTLWFPPSYRARVMAGFVVGGPLAIVVGAPLSATILGMDGLAGLKGWQWLFWIDGTLTIVWGVVALWWLDDSPATARWLTAEERQWLMPAAVAHAAAHDRDRRREFMQLLADARIWRLVCIHFGVVAGLYGVVFWLPQVVKAFGLTNLQTGFVVAVPYALAVFAMFSLGIHSDRSSERAWHIAGPLLVASAAFLATCFLHDPRLLMVVFSIATMGMVTTQALFWTLPTSMLGRDTAPTGIALINSLSNLAGFAAPYMLGWLKTRTGNVMDGYLVLALLASISAALALRFRKRSSS